jgi:hypothetical protein
MQLLKSNRGLRQTKFSFPKNRAASDFNQKRALLIFGDNHGLYFAKIDETIWQHLNNPLPIVHIVPYCLN